MSKERKNDLTIVQLDFNDGVSMYVTASGMATFVAGGLMTNYVIPLEQAEEIVEKLAGGRRQFEVRFGYAYFEYDNGLVKFRSNSIAYNGLIERMEVKGEEAAPF